MPGLVDAGFADWLRSPALFASLTINTPAGLLAGAVESEIISPLATKAGADTELARQGAFLGGPLAVDVHTVKGQRRDLIAQPVTIVGIILGYSSAGTVVFVIEAEEREGDLTDLTVLRKLT